MPTDVEIAWLAGLLEGEGCFSCSKPRQGRRAQLVVYVKMTDADVVVRAAKLIGAPSVRRVRDTRKENFSDCYQTRVSGAKAEDTMRLVLPYMGERRVAKINELLRMENLSHHDRV